MQIDREVPYREKWKFSSKWVARGHDAILGEFWDPFYISRTAKVDISYADWPRGVLMKSAKLGQRGRHGVTLPTFAILEPLYISATVEARNFKFCTQTEWLTTS